MNGTFCIAILSITTAWVTSLISVSLVWTGVPRVPLRQLQTTDPTDLRKIAPRLKLPRLRRDP
jgi:hypothetical protein